MRILLISQYFLPQPLANAEVIGGLSEALAARGHVIDVVTPVRGERGSMRVNRYPTLGYFPRDRSSITRRSAEYLVFTFAALIRGAMTPPPDLIFVPSPPPTLGLVGVVLGTLRRVPTVYNVQDLYPEAAAATGALKVGLLLRALGRLMAFVYRRSSAVVVIDERFAAAIRRAAPAAKVVAIRNGVDQAVLRGAKRDETLLADIGVRPNRPVVMYAGNVGLSQDLHAVARATSEAGAELVIHGAGAALHALKDAAAAGNWPHVHFSPYRDRSDLGRVFASADLHVVPLRAGVASASVPSKLLSIFSSGRPALVAAELESAAADMVRDAGGGWVVPAGDEVALRTSLLEALADPEELERRGAQARAWSEDGASLDRMAGEYEALFQSLHKVAR